MFTECSNTFPLVPQLKAESAPYDFLFSFSLGRFAAFVIQDEPSTRLSSNLT
jgi:hypothetical protein